MFFTNFVDKCNKIGKSPSAVAEEMGYQRSVITRWSKGTAPRQATLQKVAAYFGCTVSDLTGEKEKPTGTAADELSQSDIKIMELLKLLPEESKANVAALLEETLRLSGLME